MQTTRPKFTKTTQIQLPQSLVDAWAATVLTLARLPRGSPKKDLPASQRLKAILFQEMSQVEELWAVFTQERGELSRKLLASKRLSVAYLLGFHLANAARAQIALERADARHGLGKKLAEGTTKPIVIHDLGAGTGACSQTFIHFLRQAGVPASRLKLHLYDGVGPLLDATHILFAECEPDVKPLTHRMGLESLDADRLLGPAKDAPLSVQLLGYVWNELARNPIARNRLSKLFEIQAKRGDEALILLLEPATQDMSREAMRLRDQLVGLGYRALYPCPAGGGCPMLELSRDWCYSEGQWARPASVTVVDDKLGIDRSRVSGTMMLFASPALDWALKFDAKTPAVIVGRPDRPNAPKTGPKPFDYLLCDDGQLKKQAPTPGTIFLPRGDSLTD